MIEKVNPSHPDKVADRLAGAIVDLAYTKKDDPKIAVEILLGHQEGTVIIESDVRIDHKDVQSLAERIVDDTIHIYVIFVPQDPILNKAQEEGIRCGDNGIFKGAPLTEEEKELSQIARDIYKQYPTDGKYILDGNKLTVCQSHCQLYENEDYEVIFNPLGYWTGGLDVDAGATNRKLGSDMAQSVTGGGLHGKDLSKADVSVNIYAFLKAQETGKTVSLSCSIGDTEVDGRPYSEIVKIAREYIDRVGGFEKFAEWGLF